MYTCALVYQTPDRAAEGYLGVSRQLIVCVCTDILYILSVLYYQDLGRGIPTTMEEPWPSWALGLGIGLKLFLQSIQGACKVPQTTVPSPPPTLSRGQGRSGESLK